MHKLCDVLGGFLLSSGAMWPFENLCWLRMVRARSFINYRAKIFRVETHGKLELPIKATRAKSEHSSRTTRLRLIGRQKLICRRFDVGANIFFSHFWVPLCREKSKPKLTRRVSLAVVVRFMGASWEGICAAVIPLNPIVLLLMTCCWLINLIPVTISRCRSLFWTLNLSLSFLASIYLHKKFNLHNSSCHNIFFSLSLIFS